MCLHRFLGQYLWLLEESLLKNNESDLHHFLSLRQLARSEKEHIALFCVWRVNHKALTESAPPFQGPA